MTLLTPTEVDASTALTEAMVDLARVMAASDYHNPHRLSELEVVHILLHSDHFITGLWAGCVKRMVEDRQKAKKVRKVPLLTRGKEVL